MRRVALLLVICTLPLVSQAESKFCDFGQDLQTFSGVFYKTGKDTYFFKLDKPYLLDGKTKLKKFELSYDMAALRLKLRPFEKIGHGKRTIICGYFEEITPPAFLVRDIRLLYNKQLKSDAQKKRAP